ncbi:MAG: DUF1998 domain-containing protein [Bacteroidota bacterium]|nr:DUF1998 domain-containing protein [Bacteroidota bacterium]MDE2645413.1 DUF1998 domain-containing protein [Bacteroidota bacterium]
MADNILRQSQLITTYGPGAMMDLPDRSVIIAGLGDWSYQGRERIEETRLVTKLKGILQVPNLSLWTPPRHEEGRRKSSPVHTRIFPTWFIVKDSAPSPHHSQWRRQRLVRWNHLQNYHFIDDDGKRKKVVPVRFVCGCRRGHIDDLDWRRLAHQGETTCTRPLWLEERGTGAGIGDIFVVCDCGQERSLYEASGPQSGILGRCKGKRLWIGPYATELCNENYRLLVRTASNAYFTQTMSVISLPEYDSGLASRVADHFDAIASFDSMEMLEHFRKNSTLDVAFDGIPDKDVLSEYHRQKGGGEESDGITVKAAEFDVLSNGKKFIGENNSRSRFYAETLSRDFNQYPFTSSVDKLVLVHRLREVVALLGFTRFEATTPNKDGELDLKVIRASLADEITWLPAIENRGEGVFLSFKQDHIHQWLARPGVKERGQQILKGYKAWAEKRNRSEDDFPGLPYIMLHSLSHMLMTAIALECGYPTSSLRERVYSGEDGYGILIYTGSSDSEGTLGGLIETGRRLESHLQRALREGCLCSNDPVCAEHSPEVVLEGRALLGAACHGCLLIAESSCEQRNNFLDRALVVPTIADKDAAFFEPPEF